MIGHRHRTSVRLWVEKSSLVQLPKKVLRQEHEGFGGDRLAAKQGVRVGRGLMDSSITPTLIRGHLKKVMCTAAIPVIMARA